MRSYRHSGRVSVRALVVPPAIVLCSAVLGFVYSYGVVWIPIVGLVSLVLIFGYVFGVGYAVERLVEWAHVRSRPFAVAMGLLAGAANVYFAWVAFLHALLSEPGGFGLIDAMNPLFMLVFVPELAEVGWMTVKGGTPTGGLLWGLWAGEAAVLLGVPVWYSLGLPDRPYCERCGAWTHRADAVMVLGENLGADVKGAVERLDLPALAGLELPCAGDRVFQLLEPHRCPRCADFATLSLVHATVNPPDDQGNSSVTRRVDVPWQVVTGDELASVAEMAEVMAAARDAASQEQA